MGHDPASDWPTPPFRRDRNHLLVAANRGFGTVNIDKIDFESEVDAPLNEFNSEETDPPKIVASIRKTACEQGLFYQEREHQMIDRFRNEFICLREGDVIWHGPNPSIFKSHREFSKLFPEGASKPGQAIWIKFVDPDKCEGENYSVYNECLAGMSG